MHAVFFFNKHHQQKALYARTPFQVKRQLTFEQFIEAMHESTTIVPYAPRKRTLAFGLLGTKTTPSTELYDADGGLIPGNFTRSKEHMTEKSKLLCIDLDTHYLLDVYGKLTGNVHEIIRNLPTETNILQFMKDLGLDLSKLNHLIYKSTSYGKRVEYKKEHFDKTNMHIWLSLGKALTYKEQADFVDRLFHPVDVTFPRRLRGLDSRLKPRTAPVLPDMVVYSAARLLVQGNLAGRVISSKHDGVAIPSTFIKSLMLKKLQALPLTELYTRKELKQYAGDVTSFNLVNSTSLTTDEFQELSKRNNAVLQSGELYADDPVYMDNVLKCTFADLRSDMEAEQRKDASGSALFTEDKDVTVNISDILDPLEGHRSNCYVVLKPDGSMYVYHYSEARWFVVLKRPRVRLEDGYTVERYIPKEHIEKLHENHCIIAPTGTGKTFHVIHKVLKHLREGTVKKVVWTVPDYAALQSIEAEVLAIGTKGIKFKAIIAGKDKFDSFEENQFVVCTMSKLNGELQGRTKLQPTADHSKGLFTPAKEEHKIYDTSEWSFVVDEVHTLFTSRGQAERFMYYRILQRELLYRHLIVMSASMTEELLPGHHDRGWLATSQGYLTPWGVYNYHLAKPRTVKVTTMFPWKELLDSSTTSALVMSATALKAVGVFEELKKAHPDSKVLLYVGLPRNAAEMSIQEYPYKDKQGHIKYRQYERPTNKELKEADFVVATALTAGTSLSRPYKYCVVDMQSIPHTLETRSVEIQKISRARHPDVKRILVISGTRFIRGESLGLSPNALRTNTLPMHALDYETSMQLGVNKKRTDILSPDNQETAEDKLIAENVVKEEAPAFLKKHILTLEPARTVKEYIERDALARFDIHKAASAYYQEKDKFIAFSRESYEGPWGGGFLSYIDEEEESAADDELSLGKSHSIKVKAYMGAIKKMSAADFEAFMRTPPKDKAMDRAQQNIRKIEVPETPTCDPRIGLLPIVYVTNPETVVRYGWAPEFYQRMKQDASLAMKARRQNNILCSAPTLYMQSVIEPDVLYPVSMAKDLLLRFIRFNETREAIQKIDKSPLGYLKKLGRIEYYSCHTTAANKVLKPGDKRLAMTPVKLSGRSKKEATHFVFTLGWFSMDDPQYIINLDDRVDPAIEKENGPRLLADEEKVN